MRRDEIWADARALPVLRLFVRGSLVRELVLAKDDAGHSINDGVEYPVSFSSQGVSGNIVFTGSRDTSQTDGKIYPRYVSATVSTPVILQYCVSLGQIILHPDDRDNTWDFGEVLSDYLRPGVLVPCRSSISRQLVWQDAATLWDAYVATNPAANNFIGINAINIIPSTGNLLYDPRSNRLIYSGSSLVYSG